MVENIYLGNALIIIAECIALRNIVFIMNNIMDVHKLSINLDINRYIEYTLMYIGYECVGYKCVGYVFIYTLMYSCIKPYK